MTRQHVSEFISGLKAASHPAIAPDGSRLAYIVTETDAESMEARSHLWMATIDGSQRTRLTWRDRPVSGPAWSPDGTSIVFVSSHESGDRHNISLMPIDGGEAKVVATVDHHPAWITFAPDGKSIAFTMQVDPDHDASRTSKLPRVRVVTRLDYKEDGLGLPNNMQYQAFVLDLACGEPRQLTEGRFDQGALAWSPDGATIGSIRHMRIGLQSQLSLIDVNTGDQRLIGPEDHAVRGWAWSPDGASIAMFRSPHPEFDGDVLLLNVASGEERRLTNGMRWCLEYSPSIMAWIDESTLVIAGYESARSGLWKLDIHTGSLEPVGLHDAYHSGVHHVPGTSEIVRGLNAPDATGELIAVDVATGDVRQLTELNRDFLAAHVPGTVEQLGVENEGVTVEYMLKKPHDFDPGKKYPVIFEIHGGPHMFRGFELEVSNQLFLDNGYLVVCPNPRGSLSYGLDYAKAVMGDWGGCDWRDNLAVVDAVTRLPYVDPRRIGIYGYSYGGYMTSWAVGQTDRFKAAVIGAPLTDLRMRDGTSDIGFAAEWLEYGGASPDLPAQLMAQSPVTHAHNAKTPSLILHPEDDQRCPIGQGEQMFLELTRAGVETQFVRYPGQSHLMPWTGPAEYKVDFYTRILDWFGKYL
jgi:dipeptidyl aminopeptidase/acylaminoacyl peptidase